MNAYPDVAYIGKGRPKPSGVTIVAHVQGYPK